ncbi:hemolysin family protein [Actinoallomurus purpureus]|uniref:hemolysin family protein n=1 Tax=Actinoallomurus purpureus TaxID=478114 RepID=UPI0020939D14|nr:hemolysin family protein [Actinoallomurus purpureus]MCO6005117.1 hemolysin family protein [Actinoallomurus purpureus]
MDPLTSAVVTLLLLACNAFFVASEFALVAAKRPRLERTAARGSTAARAAVAGIDELSLMLAGAQLGITMCSLGLGVVTEPAFETLLDAPLAAAGVPEAAGHAVAFTLALGVVTFLHMVAGEMAPKSWAIAHPERSALILAIPFRGFARLSRPLLAALNGVTGGLLRLAGVRPGEETEAPADPQRLTHLIGESRRMGLIDHAEHDLLGRAITTRHAGIDHLVVPAERVTAVPADATPEEIRRASAASGHTRLLVRDGQARIRGLLHVRDALPRAADGRTAGDMTYPVPTLSPGTTVLAAVSGLRRARAQLALVATPENAFIGIVSLDDLLSELLAGNPH